MNKAMAESTSVESMFVKVIVDLLTTKVDFTHGHYQDKILVGERMPGDEHFELFLSYRASAGRDSYVELPSGETFENFIAKVTDEVPRLRINPDVFRLSQLNESSRNMTFKLELISE